jgi:hypothetical protein
MRKTKTNNPKKVSDPLNFPQMYQKINRIIEIAGWSFLILAWFFIALEMHFTFYRSIGFSLYAHPALFSLIASFCLWTITLLISRKANFAKFI